VNTYLFGYSGNRLTLDQMTTRQTWAKLHPEFRRRLVALFDEAQDNGTDVGLGEGWRSSDVQRRTFLARHSQVRTGGCCTFEGKRWALNRGQAHAAPPGLSYHEDVTMPSGVWALAVDLVGNLDFAQRVATKHQLAHFRFVNNEPWHFQPFEVPTSRNKYDGHELLVPAEDIDMIVLDWKPNTPSWVACLWTGDVLTWIVNGHADAVLRNANMKRVTVSDDQLLGVIASSTTKGPPPPPLTKPMADMWRKQAL
jgi:hypothetical protein